MLRQYDGWCGLNMNASGEEALNSFNLTEVVMVVNIKRKAPACAKGSKRWKGGREAGIDQNTPQG